MAAIYQWYEDLGVILTTTLYPIEVVDAVQFDGASLTSGYLWNMPTDAIDHGTPQLVAAQLDHIRIEFTADPEAIDRSWSLVGAQLDHIRIEFSTDPESIDIGWALVNAGLDSKKVVAYHPDEAVDFDAVLISGYLTVA